MGGEACMEVELRILDFIQSLRTPFGDVAMPFISKLGNTGMIWIILALVLLIIPKTRNYGILVTAALLADVILCDGILKHLFRRVRPCDINIAVQLIIPRPKDFSFPSGHTWAQNSRGFPTQGKTSGHCFPAESSFVSHFCNKNMI